MDLLRRAEPGRRERTAWLLEKGYPAYTTTPGWLGYSDEKLARLSREAVADGFTQIKLKVGASVEGDVRRMRVERDAVGDGIRIAVDVPARPHRAGAQCPDVPELPQGVRLPRRPGLDRPRLRSGPRCAPKA